MSDEEFVPSGIDSEEEQEASSTQRRKRGRSSTFSPSSSAAAAAASAASAAVAAVNAPTTRQTKRARKQLQQHDMDDEDDDDDDEDDEEHQGPSAPRPHVQHKGEAQLHDELKLLRTLRGQGAMDSAVSASIVHVHTKLQLEALEYKRKTGKYKAAKAQHRTAALLGVSTSTVSGVVKAWRAEGGLYVGGKRGNFKSKHKRVALTKSNTIMVRNFIRRQRAETRQVTVTQVAKFLVEKGVLEVKTIGGIMDHKGLQAAVRAVRRFLRRAGFEQGKGSDAGVRVKEAVQDERALYVNEVMLNRARAPEDRLREVYVDETSVRRHLGRVDRRGGSKRRLHVGRRYCVIAAFQGPNPRAGDQAGKHDLAGMVPGSRWVFCPEKKDTQPMEVDEGDGGGGSSSSAAAAAAAAAGASNGFALTAVATTDPHSGDYHKNFDGANFAHWWRTHLLPNLKQSSLIIMDSAWYHKAPPTNLKPLPSMDKEEVLAELRMRAGDAAEGDTVPALKAKLKLLRGQEKPEVVQLAEAAGHRVVFLPKHHSDLQPLELVWARVKDGIARQYKDGTTFAQVQQRLEEQFAELEADEDQLQAFLERTDRVVQHFYRHDTLEQGNGKAEADDDDDDEDDFPELGELSELSSDSDA